MNLFLYEGIKIVMVLRFVQALNKNRKYVDTNTFLNSKCTDIL